MNRKLNLSKLLFANILLLSIVFCGCENENHIKQNMEIAPVIDIIPAIDCTRAKREIIVYVIDSCEYIGYINATFLTHKGNCKFCIERSKK